MDVKEVDGPAERTGEFPRGAWEPENVLIMAGYLTEKHTGKYG